MHPVRVYEHPGFERSPRVGIPPEPFRSAERAWFWTMAALRARHEGGRRPGGHGVPRPCEPDDVLRCLDGLYRCKRIDLSHARVLRTWGERGYSPDPHCTTQRTEARLWAEAMTLLEWPLRVRGIVVLEARGETSCSAAWRFGGAADPGGEQRTAAAEPRIVESDLGKKAVDRPRRPILKLTTSTGDASP